MYAQGEPAEVLVQIEDNILKVAKCFSEAFSSVLNDHILPAIERLVEDNRIAAISLRYKTVYSEIGDQG